MEEEGVQSFMARWLPPHVEEPFVTKNSTNHYEGFCIDLLNEMAAILKFNYTIIEVQDGSYGIEDETGRWNGIIGVLQRHEADLSVSAVTITYSRVEVVDFTLPFMHLGISILLARAKEDSEKCLQSNQWITDNMQSKAKGFGAISYCTVE
ncbi:hypothetical protein ANCDUO_01589 [Ancylostoma duodenale]|uniref:Ionotropic glutamate receptor L-glutamate and glycine-binding domain-containing protein n=1 Tax=Ancylostoma duodenale TaxID=51022 RepID=A0A0C2DYI6_9BILA|nr:hypothetical protein ANCDUO_01589 [Ancylostoma duodenale]